jgi:hypothetical protein
MRDMTKDECRSLKVIPAAFASPGKVCEPGALAARRLRRGDLFQ